MRRILVLLLLGLGISLLAACNLGKQRASSGRVEITRVQDVAKSIPSPTAQSTKALATVATQPNQLAIVARPMNLAPTAILFASSTPLPAIVTISHPLPNAIVQGSISVFGSAIHPRFSQYRLEYASQPNPQNLWYAVTGAVRAPAINSVLGIWNSATGNVPDGLYQLRLSVLLRNGGVQTAQVTNIQVRNHPAAADVREPLPSAEFTMKVDSDFAPVTVRFSGPPDRKITYYSWNFGDGNTSTEKNPVHTFRTAGEYGISLTVGGPTGSSSFGRKVSVRQRAAPVARFEISATSGQAPLQVEFVNNTSGEVTSYRWNFGDGHSSAEREPQHTYIDAGVYDAELVADGPGGQSRYARQIVVAEAQPPPTATVQAVTPVKDPPAPVASFKAEPQSGAAPLEVSFTNTSANADIATDWDFDGDGQSDSTERDPTAVFDLPGTYTVRLQASGRGGTDTASAEIIVNPPPPAAVFSASDTSGHAPLTVFFANETAGEVLSYEWDFQGDGLVDSLEESPMFVYEKAGIYLAQLRAIGPYASSAINVEITVIEPIAPPTAHFIVSVEDLEVSFMSTAIGEDLEYNWDFGDGSTSTEKDPLHTYLAAGNYTVIHSVSNEGGEANYEELVTVSETYQPAAAVDEKIAFTSDRDGNNEIYVMDSDGENAVNLTNHPSSDRHPAWSPDGLLIVFASRRDDNVFDIYLLDIETGAVTRLTNQGSNTRPAWSPDGARIAFVSDRFGDKDVMVMNADGSRQIQLTVDVHADDQPSWSPDGSAIAYVSNVDGQRNIYVMSSADGSEILTLTSDGSDNFQPSWLDSSMHNLLLFTSARNGNQDIFVIDPITGENLRQITGDPSDERQPTWSAGGALVVFVSDRENDGERNIYTMNTDGGNVQRLTPLGSNDREPKWR